MKSTSRFLVFLALFGASGAALAHPGHGLHGFDAGLLHPFTGLDHLLAMFAVGVWAAQSRNSRTAWALPLAFMSALAFGATYAIAVGSLTFAETGIAASLLGLGLLIALAVRLPFYASMSIAGLFGLVHGYAHGAEMPLASTPMAYAAGFLLSTAALHASGVACGWLARFQASRWLQILGAAIAGTGVWLLT